MAYTGYNSRSFLSGGRTTRLTELDLVKVNLLNHIFTRRGERIMMPDFGTTIPDMMMEPLTSDLIDELQQQITYVFSYDPRVTLNNMDIRTYYDAGLVEVLVSITVILNSGSVQTNLPMSFAFGNN